MPGVYDAYAVGYRELIFASKESTYGTPVHPAATDAMAFITTSLTHAQERVNRADKTTSRTYRNRISHRVSGAWSLNLYNLPSGTNGTPPDSTDVLEFGFGFIKIVPDTATTGVPTTTSIPITAAAGVNYAIGDFIGWVNGAGELEATNITAIVTDTLTVDPPFSVAPAAAATIKGSVTYKPANNLGSLTFTRILDNYEDVWPGSYVGSLAFAYPGTAEGTITAGGESSTSYSSGSSTLAANSLIGATSITVATGDGDQFQPNTRILIGTECLLITAVAGDVLSITHAQAGTAAAAHTLGDLVGPYEPPSTVIGEPISGTIGDFFIPGLAGATRALARAKIQTAGLNIANNGALRNAEFGKNFATGFFVKKRDVTFDVTLWLEPVQVKLYNRTKKFTTMPVMLQLGKTMGSVTVWKLPKAEFNIPRIDGGGDDEVSVPITGLGLGTLVGGNDEVFYGYL